MNCRGGGGAREWIGGGLQKCMEEGENGGSGCCDYNEEQVLSGG